MIERPILFSGEMVRAILAGRKTQTRRVVMPMPPPNRHDSAVVEYDSVRRMLIHYSRIAGVWNEINKWECPYGGIGDRLWVREAWDIMPYGGRDVRLAYRADGEHRRVSAPDGFDLTPYRFERWRPSIHMPRWASRITLEVVSARAERLRDITEQDAIAEGVERKGDAIWKRDDFKNHPLLPPEGMEANWRCYARHGRFTCCISAKQSFMTLWDSINGKREGCAWNSAPWVWAVEFKVMEAGA